jgi:hypothetical protein
LAWIYWCLSMSTDPFLILCSLHSLLYFLLSFYVSLFMGAQGLLTLACVRVARHCAKFSRNLKHSRVNPVPKLEEEEKQQWSRLYLG